MMDYVNGRFCCCHTAVSGEMMSYMKGKSYCYYIVVFAGMMGYVNRRSCCCYTAVLGKTLESDKKAQLKK